MLLFSVLVPVVGCCLIQSSPCPVNFISVPGSKENRTNEHHESQFESILLSDFLSRCLGLHFQ